MVNTRRNGQPNGSSDDDIEIPNLEAMVAAAIANMLPGLNANEAEDWITHVEKIFEVLGCGDEFKARLATFKLEGDALNWWKVHKRAKGGDVYMTTCTWAEFRSTFYKRYFPDSEQQRFEREYNTIHQKENENSGEYMQRFLRLASFVGPIAGDASRWALDRLLNTEFADVSAVNDAARNIEIFHEGSEYNKRNRDGYRIHPRAQGNDNKGYSGRVHDSRGQMDRGYDHRGQSSRNYDYRRPDTRGQDSKSTGRNGNDRQGQDYNQRQYRDQPTRGSQSSCATDSSVQPKLIEGSQLALPPPPLCPTCGKPHPGPCHRITCACFNCGSTNHRVKYCPKRNPSASMNTVGPSTTSGRVFTTTRDQAAGTSEAEDWITHVEKIFEVLGCGDEFKARLATFKLEGDALNWWKVHKRAKGGDVYMTTCTWAEFRSTFYKRYFPDSEQQRFEREYNTIHQKENENSGEYMQRFLRLASFVGPIAGDASRWALDRLLNTEFADVSAVNDAARNIEIFHEGSEYNKRNRDGYRIHPRAQGNDNKGYSGRVHDSRGQMDRGYDHRGQSSRNYDYRRPDTRGQDSKSTGRNGNDRQGQDYNQRQYRDQPTRGSQSSCATDSSVQPKLIEGSQLALPPPPLCPTCGKPHPGPCHRITCACFNCGSTNHRVKYCPKRNPSASMNTVGPSTTSGRVFTTTRDQAAGTSGFECL
ncbi:zinc finger, CCHC-type, Retrotransposon gag domain protein [Artemisia annua]|uniref:Zinc finger, CCHC-type, Retrotransposon gag domain protein n=1 Tax=Artemisia annua TaxID=35608 RepID=A0A2U1KJQ5_ARTAN|nr:zinc finger, CCHC-type, Retrotransposon gag domain protein [Artemisia annua]